MESTANSDKSTYVDTKDDPFPEARGVLLGDMIQKYIDELHPSLLEGADIPNNLRPASYNLRLGDRYYQDGQYGTLTEDSPVITIKPHGMVVVSSLEKLHMPKYLIARWNLRVKLVYSGLLWAGGPQVDPGFSGPLSCPLYNLSSKEVNLYRREHVFTIDFAKTTKYDREAAKKNPNLDFPVASMNRQLEDLLPKNYTLKSSLSELQGRVDASEKRANETDQKISSGLAELKSSTTQMTEKSVDKIEQKFADLQSGVLIGLSTVFAGLTIVATLPYVGSVRLALSLPTPDPVSSVYLALSAGALIFSAYALMRTRKLLKRNSTSNSA